MRTSRPDREPGPSRRPSARSIAGRTLGSRRSGIVDQPRPAPGPTRYSDPATTTGPSPVRSASSSAATRVGLAPTDPCPGHGRAPGRREIGGRQRAWYVERRCTRSVAPARAGTAATAATMAGDVLVGHRRPQQPSGRGGRASPPARNGRRSPSAWARAAAPSGLWAPSSSTSRRPVGATLDELEPAGPACRRVPSPARVGRDAGDGRPPRARRAARRRPPTFAAWWRPRSETSVGPSRAGRPAAGRGSSRGPAAARRPSAARRGGPPGGG